ncbi:guanylate kinase, partial [Klebsiella pneumoniae]|nr:guanylate kinase [Klebsiella pneumoniae]
MRNGRFYIFIRSRRGLLIVLSG